MVLVDADPALKAEIFLCVLEKIDTLFYKQYNIYI